MNYKIIALDLDGTLTNHKKVITPKTREALIKFQENGGKVILASGRPSIGIYPQAKVLCLERFGGYILAFNGGRIIECSTGRTVFQTVFPLEYIPEIYDAIKGHPVGINTYHNDKIIAANHINDYTKIESKINNMDIEFVDDFVGYINFDINKCLLQGDPSEILKFEKIFSEKYKDRLGIFKSEEFFLEMMPNGIDKASSIDKLLKSIGIKTEECIACGDGFNDISMIKYAGMGVAMSNAKDEVKAVSNFVTLSNDEDGIAYVLKKFCGIE